MPDKTKLLTPPAGIDDFDQIPNQREAWHDAITYVFEETIRELEGRVGEGKSQYKHPLDAPSTGTKQLIPWKGFPKSLDILGPVKSFEEAEKLVTVKMDSNDPNNYWGVDTIQRRQQDEYLEWYTECNKEGEIIRVTFTCEGPEYWQALAEGYPFFYPEDRERKSQGNRDLVLKLYQEYISPKVTMEDLFINGRYFPYNKWNTTHGAMHLTHRANTLAAEIILGGEATIIRKKAGKILDDAQGLINCSNYGKAERDSDPTIGWFINNFARAGNYISIKDPVGLYMTKLDTSGWVCPIEDNGEQANPQDFWKIVRGKEGMILRAVFEVPTTKKYKVSDITIAKSPIRSGGEIAKKIHMHLTGIAWDTGKANESIECPPPLNLESAETVSIKFDDFTKRTSR
ncbi:hypothetical protein [Priestia megaterium]|uniref:hypothetical protein n=1 Tax=Priestia megaterium TaxID=1404 RepID=UPI001C52C737|nr:hypothetical protein [Priestia megaterium]MBW0931382.1 hypothetical protein [Priestia megaterium]